MAVPMWGKYFACTFTGSMFGCGLHAHVVWGYVISHTGLHDHLVELNPAVLAAAIGCDVEGIVKAIDFLCSPDPNSRSDREDGRRLIRRGQFTYYVVNHEEYSRLRNEVERRGQNRNAKRAQRARVSCDVVNDVSHGQPRSATVSGRGCPAMSLTMSAQREEEEEGEEEQEEEKKDTAPPVRADAKASAGSKKFSPPNPNEVDEHLATLGETRFSGEEFCDYYGSVGWMVGKKHMRDWHRAVGTWRRGRDKKGEPQRAAGPSQETLDAEARALKRLGL